MIGFRKPRLTTFTFFDVNLKPSLNPRFHTTKPKLPSKSTIKEAQSALLEYLHSTRSLQFLDADNMCKNSPFFLQNLVQETLKNDKSLNTKRSISRYLRYHPINEFEPFFESLGLKPSEYAPFLPRGMIFLYDDTLLMENYHILCNYGVPRSKMWKFFKLAPQVFRFENGVLNSKLTAYENLGIGSSILVDAITVSPCLLVGDVNVEFVKVVEKLKSIVSKCGDGDSCWIEWHFLDEASCNWGFMLEVLCLLSNVDFSEEQLAEIIRRRPCVVFEESGGTTLSMIGFLMKFGLSVNQIALVFLEFPQIPMVNFFANLRRCFQLLTQIEMEAAEIGKIFQSHTLFVGSFTLKTTKSLLGCLNVGKRRLCKMVQDNPHVMKNWVLGRKVQPLVSTKEAEEEKSRARKMEFLTSLGYVENTKQMNSAIKVFRGKGAELQKRFDFIVKAGLTREDVCRMIRVSPQILNQNTDRVKMKIEYLVKEGYSVSDLVTFPSYLSYTPIRFKLRMSMYNWLKEQGAAEQGLALSTIIACTDKVFIQQYVNRHPSGLQVWEDLQKEIQSEDE
ncbi:transcription termination factor MTEF18, mitochondrial-like [Cicer arietinum]|uniref:Transcription termination factor MTEF18, mitochondrial-like n=1 Tax=Cicer arietinum TaxID=3827 RepID=A0A1S2XS66_CICAR|nr:transcription termination factor MTEF18, mitochondrial-like [Cicer arietinum]